MSAPFDGNSQATRSVPLVAYLSVLSPADSQVQRGLDAFRQNLAELGYVEGRSVVVEYRWAEGRVERLAELAHELVRLKPDVLIASGGLPVAQAAQQATRTIPIIITGPADPVAAGLVASLSHPGGNITGMAIISHELVGKELELLRELVPKLSRVAVLWNPANPGNAQQFRAARVATSALGLVLQSHEVRGAGGLDHAFAAMKREQADALVVLLDSMLLGHRVRIAQLAASHRLPAVYGLQLHVTAGGLMAYAAHPADVSRRIVGYIDRILKGAKPADLPIELPTRFELVINMRAARALGLTPPQSLLLRADQIIE